MKCPAMLVGVWTESKDIQPGYGDCLEEKCAWWNDEANICSVFSLALNIAGIRRGLQNIAKEMTLLKRERTV